MQMDKLKKYMSDNMLDQALEKNFGFTGFKPGQKAVMEIIMQGRSSLLCFQPGLASPCVISCLLFSCRT